jgi:hypothetical protein
MTSPFNKDTKIVLKLDLGENGVRRVPLSKLWDESRSVVSYERLVQLAISFSDIRPRAVQNGRATVATTYIDEDGDEITISSDEELAEAFAQFINAEPPVVYAKALFVKQKKLRAGGMNQEPKQKPARNNNIFSSSLKTLNEVNPKAPFPPVVRVPPVESNRRVLKTNKCIPKTNDYEAGGCDPNFIHGRHTCDGCLSTPIFGIRYHALNMPDYDLCSSCYSNYKGTEIKFKPMQLDRDCHLQDRWQRRRMRRFSVVTKQGLVNKAKSGTQTRRVLDDLDDDLKQALRNSLADAYPSEKKSDEASVKTEATKSSEGSKAEPTKEDKEVEIPVEPVVEISAGNQHTQKALDEMSPKVKEAISRSLNEFFERRAKRNQESVPPKQDHDLKLEPVGETQQKIESMDPAVQEAIRRSLNNFFASRRALKLKEKNTETEPEEESQDEIKRTQEILDTMDAEAKEKISRTLNDFFARRVKKNDAEATLQNEDVNQEVGSVVLDIVVDDEDDDLSLDVSKIELDNESKIELDNESKLSEDSIVKDEWQMVTEDDEMIAVAAQMLGSALFQSNASLSHDSVHSS